MKASWNLRYICIHTYLHVPCIYMHTIYIYEHTLYFSMQPPVYPFVYGISDISKYRKAYITYWTVEHRYSGQPVERMKINFLEIKK